MKKIKISDIEVTDVLIVMVQFQYLTRKPLRFKKAFFKRMYENIRRCKFDPKAEVELMALASNAERCKGNHPVRVGIYLRAMDIISDLVRHGMHIKHT